jgi:CspA family cold shock protein
VLGEVLGDPPGPLHTIRRTIGTVKWWRDDKGYGLITSEETGPWDIWCHFAAIEQKGFRSLAARP